MLYSHDVKFNEEEFGIKKEGAVVEPVKVVEIGNDTVSDSDVVCGDTTTTIPALRRFDVDLTTTQKERLLLAIVRLMNPGHFRRQCLALSRLSGKQLWSWR